MNKGMRMKHLFLFILYLWPIAIFVGCDSNGLPSKGADNESENCKPQTKDFITVNRNHYVVGSAGGQITVDIESNVEYEIYISDDWISYDAKKSCISLLFSIQKNSERKDRDGFVKFISKDGKISQTIYICQVCANGSNEEIEIGGINEW